MNGMADTSTLSQGLRTAIERGGYYPNVVADAIQGALAGERLGAWVVHQEATFEREEIRRHVTVLALTPTRLVAGHVDEHPSDESSPVPYATATTEAVPLHRIASVMVTRVVGEPSRYVSGAPLREVVLSMSWGAVSRLDLEPASCSDPACEADHGYTGTANADDLTLRVSEAGDGPGAVSRALAFADALSTATARAGRLGPG
jgi:Family of unknown function (DUF5998)